MKAIYIISTEEWSKINKYKLGGCTGPINKLMNRYTTYHVIPVIYYFREIDEYIDVEDKLKNMLIQFRLKSAHNNRLEWLIINLDTLIRCVDVEINLYEENKNNRQPEFDESSESDESYYSYGSDDELCEMEHFIEDNYVVTNSKYDCIHKNVFIEHYKKYFNLTNIIPTTLIKDATYAGLVYDKNKQINGQRGFYIGIKRSDKNDTNKYVITKTINNSSENESDNNELTENESDNNELTEDESDDIKSNDVETDNDRIMRFLKEKYIKTNSGYGHIHRNEFIEQYQEYYKITNITSQALIKKAKSTGLTYDKDKQINNNRGFFVGLIPNDNKEYNMLNYIYQNYNITSCTKYQLNTQIFIHKYEFVAHYQEYYELTDVTWPDLLKYVKCAGITYDRDKKIKKKKGFIVGLVKKENNHQN